MEQQESPSPSILPGSTSKCSINLRSTDLEREEAMFISFTVTNAHATASVTLINGPFHVFDYLRISVNNGNQTFTVDNVDSIREIMGETYLNYGLFVYEDSAFVRNETTTSAGITIAAGATATFYYPLDPIISWAGTCVQGEITNLEIDVRATSEQTSAGGSGYLFKCSTDAAMWTRALVTIADLKFVRSFTKLNSAQQLVRFMGSVSNSVPIRFVHWKVHPIILKEGTANSGDTVVKKLSDIYKADTIQHVSFTIRKTQTAFNGADCGKEYSGYRYLGWKWRELNKGGTSKTLDMSDARKLREFESKQYRNEYGRKQLPIELLTDNTNTFAQYFLRLTRMNFDYLPVEQAHEVLRYTNSNQDDYEITLYCNATVGSSCQWMAYVTVAEVYEYDRNNGQLKLINA